MWLKERKIDILSSNKLKEMILEYKLVRELNQDN
jgi:hypothetical protein